MRSFQAKQLVALIFMVGVSFTLVQVYLVSNDENPKIPDDAKIILWWTPFGSEEKVRKCGDFNCFFTDDRVYQTHPHLKGILFYGSNLKIDDLPIPRAPDIRWGLLHEESPRNCLLLTNPRALELFNYSATFSRWSDVPLTLLDLPSLEILSDTTYFHSTKKKNQLIRDEGLAPVLYIQSNCDTVNDRDNYVSELMKYIKIDSYGTCLNNRKLPDNLKDNYISNLDSNEFRMFVGQYKFTLAFENAVCHDYITEKLWRPLIVGSVPVYYGSPSFKDWLPTNNSAIAVEDFQGPKQLADYLKILINNDDDYEEYLKHKLVKNSIKNLRLINELKKRPSTTFNIFYDYVKSFECSVCKKLHDNDEKILKLKHYNCPRPKSIFNGTVLKNWWIDSWNQGECLANIMYNYVLNNSSINYKKISSDKIKCKTASNYNLI